MPRANVAKSINDHPSVSYRIEGHTDSIGTHEYNEDLSQRRASTVRSYLENHGVAGGRLELAAHGETAPVASNDTAAGRAQNRRVDIKPIN
jgi:OOP family OmpA-OmpF porin